MKKSLVPLLLLFFLISCGNDDEELTPVEEPTSEICMAPTAIQTSAIEINSTTLSWSNSNATATYSIEYGLKGFTQGSGTTVTSNETSTTIAGLDADTEYDVYVKAICGANDESDAASVLSFKTAPPRVIAEFLPNLSDLNLFSGDLNSLTPSQYAFEYNLITPLFSDYSSKQRIVALPEGTKITPNGEGMPDFPENTLIAKTFFYNIDDRDTSLGKTIIETRILLKKNGLWETGDYIWNDDQTEAVLDNSGSEVPITYIDSEGDTQNVNYKIPSGFDCAECHVIADVAAPLGPKLRNLNANNQLQDLIANGYLEMIDVSSITPLPKWDDATFSIEERARAYMDVNCASCHIDGGSCENNSILRLPYELDFSTTKILDRIVEIDERMQFYVPDFSMPQIGTTMIHIEGYELVREYLDSL